MQLRVLWVPPQQRAICCGVAYTEEELRAAGLDPAKMLRHGEAEDVSPEPKAMPKKKKGK
jgi:hypothetical protein